jgi:hypothetical protein
MIKKLLITLLTGLVLATSAQAELGSKELFEKLQEFSGEWEFIEGEQRGSCTHGEDAIVPIEFKMIGKNTAIQENLMPGSAYQMVTMYHLEDLNEKDVIGTHYCVKKNQPAYRADLANSTSDKIIFKCDKTRTKLCTSEEPYGGSYVDSVVYEILGDGDTLTVHYMGRGQKLNDPGYTRCKFTR